MEPELPYRRASGLEDAISMERLLATCFAIPVEHAGAWVQRVGLDNVRLLGDDSGAAPAGLGILSMGQWFGGRRVSCAGIAAVGVAPEQRGRGLGRQLMTRTLRELADDRFGVSCLYPATMPVYRAVGYEVAGARYEMRMPCAALAGERGSGTIVPLGGIEDPALRACQAESALRGNGELDRHEALWLRVSEHRGEARDGYAVRDVHGRMRGYVFLARRVTTPPRHDIGISDVVALDRDAALTLLHFLHGHRSIARDVIWCGGTDDPLRAAVADVGWTMSLMSVWMTRIVHVETALVSRGYPRAVRGAVHLDVEDPLLPDNQGRFVLEVEGGEGTVRRGGEGRVSLSIRDLAAMYTGHSTAEKRQQQGQVRGHERDLSLLTSLFAGPPPAMPDMF